jgi:hypothetical protein
MAIIYSYPEKTSPAGGDFLVITDSEEPAPNKNRTKSLTIDNLASYVVSSTNAITGGGTLNTMAMFTPDGQKIGNSFMTYDPQSQFFVISKRLSIDGDLSVFGRGSFSGPYLRVGCPLQVLSVLQDGNGLSGTAGQVLSSTETGVQWTSETNTTYDLTGQVSNTTDFAIGLTGSDGTLDKVSLIAGSNITLTDNGSNGVTIASSNPGGTVTGSGTTNTIPVWTDGANSVLGDSVIIQNALAQVITIEANLEVEDDITVQGSIQCNSNLTVESLSTFNGNVLVDGEYLEIQCPIKDHSANLPSSAGQILVGDAGGNVTWTDSTDIVSGAVAKLIPFKFTASAGGSSTYSANNNIVEIGWTGGNGTYILNIPSATDIPYRNIRFVTNSTFPNGASDKVQITARVGETIDGAAFFEISKVYEGVSIWSNGTEWIVIQAKAH